MSSHKRIAAALTLAALAMSGNLVGCRWWLGDEDICADDVDRVRWYADADADGYGASNSPPYCTPAAGMVDNADDCDDDDPGLGSVASIGEVAGLTRWCRDDDRDGVGRSDDCLTTCFPPEGYEAPEAGDCDDANPYFTVVCPWAQVSADSKSACAVRSDGTLSCWGDDSGLIVSDAPTGDGWVEVAVGVADACARHEDGAVTCWGADAGQPPDDLEATLIDAGWGSFCALDGDGAVVCWDSGASWLYPEVEDEAPAGDGFVDLALGEGAACAIDGEGVITCWGAAPFSEMIDDTPDGAGYRQVSLAHASYVAYACAIAKDGGLECWGDAPSQPSPTRPPEGDDYVQVEVGAMQAWALHEDGTLEHWGSEYDDPLDGYEDFDDVVRLAVGEAFTCALRQQGRLSCWGNSRYGQTDAPTPNVEAIAAGGTSSCSVTELGGHLTCWGDPLSLPDLVFTKVDTSSVYRCVVHEGGRLDCWSTSGGSYADMPQGAGYQDVMVAGYIACAVAEDGSLDCWDDYGFGSTPPPGNDWTATDVSGSGGCALDGDGAVACWGQYDSDEVPQGTGFVDVSVGGGHGCVIDDEGLLECWGGFADSVTHEFGDPWEVPDEAGFVQISCGFVIDCALRGDGTVTCWNGDGELTETPDDDDFVFIEAGGYQEACGLHVDGSVSCWVGRGGYSALTGAATPSRDGWVGLAVDDDGTSNACVIDAAGGVECWGGYDRVRQPDEHLAAPSLGASHGCAMWRDQVRCFGSDDQGQASPPLDGFEAVFAGGDHSCAVDDAGTVACWGADGDGESPVPSGLGPVASLALGRGFTCALLADGTLTCWGDGEAADPPAGASWAGVAAGRSHACALDADGGVSCWGSDAQGQASVPAGLGRSTQVVAGDYHSCALAEDGYPTCWGEDGHRQDSSPKVRFTTLAAGGEHTCGIRLDGLPWCWGRDLEGQATPPGPEELIGD